MCLIQESIWALSQVRGGFEAHIEGLFTNRDLISERDDRETRTLFVDEV